MSTCFEFLLLKLWKILQINKNIALNNYEELLSEYKEILK